MVPAKEPLVAVSEWPPRFSVAPAFSWNAPVVRAWLDMAEMSNTPETVMALEVSEEKLPLLRERLRAAGIALDAEGAARNPEDVEGASGG